MPLISEFAEFALDLAAAARGETLARWRREYRTVDKGIGAYDPVTDADREAERAMRKLISRHYPGHAIEGEEFPVEPGKERWTWSLDPIDGTRSFICGLPTWITLIALLDGGAPVLGLVDAPCLDETYIGYEGLARMRTKGGVQPIGVSTCTSLSGARLSTTDPALFEGHARASFEKLAATVRTLRYGHDGYAYARLAAGSIDLVVESGLKTHDYQALVPLVRAAGGVVGGWTNRDDLSSGNLIAASSEALYLEAAAYFEALE